MVCTILVHTVWNLLFLEVATEAINPSREFFLGENYSELVHSVLFEMEIFIRILLAQMYL